MPATAGLCPHAPALPRLRRPSRSALPCPAPPLAAFTAEELVSHQEVFEHLILRIEKEAVLELGEWGHSSCGRAAELECGVMLGRAGGGGSLFSRQAAT